jgi:hypothetical protein
MTELSRGARWETFWREKLVAFCMGSHLRLGGSSLLLDLVISPASHVALSPRNSCDAPLLKRFWIVFFFGDADGTCLVQVEHVFECVCEAYWGPRVSREWTESTKLMLREMYYG